MVNAAAAAKGGGGIPGVQEYQQVQSTISNTTNTMRKGESDRLAKDISTIGEETSTINGSLSKASEKQIDNLR